MSSIQDATQWHTKQNTALPADVDNITFDDVAAREVAVSGELQATSIALTTLRGAALTTISWLANWRTGHASIDELDVRMNALKCACDTAEKPAEFGAHILLEHAQYQTALERIRHIAIHTLPATHPTEEVRDEQ